jgi:hypothetical protein
MTQNTGHSSASERPAAGARGFVDGKAVGAKLKLGPGQAIILAQSMGQSKP